MSWLPSYFLYEFSCNQGWMLTKCSEKKARWELHKNTLYCFEQILEATPHKNADGWSLTSHLTSHLTKMKKIHRALLQK